MATKPKDQPAFPRNAAAPERVPPHVYSDDLRRAAAPETRAAPAPAPEAPKPAPTPHPAPQPQPRKGGAGAMMLGGAVAAALGFGAGYVINERPGFDPAPLQRQMATQADEIAALRDRIAALPGAPDLSGLEAGLSTAQSGLAALEEAAQAQAQTLAALDQRLVAVEQRGTAEGEADAAALNAYQRELEALRTQARQMQATTEEAGARLAALEADAATLRAASEGLRDEARAAQEQADTARRLAAARMALSEIDTALAQGGSYSEALPPLAAVTDLPAALSAPAEGGVATLPDLIEAWALPARAALAATREAGDSGEEGGGRVGSFLRSQFQLRSTTAQDGTSADAILSRAEAALRGGDIATTLTEIDTLPASAQPPLADWRAAARTRLEATEAAAALSQTLTEK